MAGVRTLLVWIVVAECWIQLIKGSCPAGKFGDLCSYFCHCGNDCNRTTGVCSTVCDKGWVGGHGKTCQKENVAYNKNARTPSGLYPHDPPWSADKAVDGNRDQNVLHNSCFHSAFKDSKAVWTVDLGQPYRIHHVRIYNRAGYILRIRTAALSVSNSRSNTSIVPCYTFPSNTTKDNSVYDVTCDAMGQYVTIKHGTETLNLCEVEIYVCSQGTFGADCNSFCHCSVGPCDRVSGLCTGNCRPGWQGQSCSVECDRDHYGVNCDETCGNRKCASDTSSCDRHTGSCDTGCLPGWTAVDCTLECSLETYGQNCSKQCTDRNCAGNSSCDHVTGTCVAGCKAGWMGKDCVEVCEAHRYGRNCVKTCATRHCAGNSSCNSTGNCDSGCETGWTLDDCTACNSQHYGAKCTKLCVSRYCVGNSSCNSTGHCDSGCETGWTQSDCTVFQEAVTSDPDDSVPTYVGAAVGVFLFVLVLVLIFSLIRRRRISERKHCDVGLVSKTRESSQDEGRADDNAGNVYMNVGYDGGKQSVLLSKKIITQSQPKDSDGADKSEEEEKEEVKEREEDYDCTIQEEPAPEIPDRTYYNLDEADVGQVISVSSLEARVGKFEELTERVEEEFKRLPDGFIHSYWESQMPNNNGKNRFKGYYPYDYNRVLLQDASDGGDYINASYLDGYKRDKRYIAAQGPYNSQVVVDFWRMIWKEECRTVVMVTGLVEEGKVKCLRYWPEKGTKTFGDVMVTMVSETRLSNYTITKMSVENEKECKKRDVHHLHFTSWPDHGVPDAAALLDFMWRVKVITEQQTQPIIVHCSAGIGRTGTYIAIESLVEQAKSEGVVDVVSFVSNMRGQRKNMIQTKEQYMFVYKAVARVVAEGDTSLDAEVIRQMDLDHVSDINFGNKTVRQHLEALRNVHRGNSESVNVRSVHSYTKRNGFFIMTSHPDKEEVWNQVYNSDSHCLLTLAVGDLSYLPSVDSPITTKQFAVIMRSSTPLSNGFLLNTIDIISKDCDDTTTIQHYHITGNARDPNISWLIDSFLTWTSDPQRSSSTIVSDSVTDCRLLVLLVNIASRLQDDGRVDVINNMQQLYTRLGGPPFTEADVTFCLESAQRRLVSSNIYSNF